MAYVTGTVDQELLLRNEYLAAENRILRAQIKGRVQLTDPERKTLAEIAKRLGQAGYDRGPVMTQIFSERLSDLGEFLGSHGVEDCERLLASGSKAEITALLSPAKGVGPRVLENLFLLRGTSE